jgi:hypothetical protein
MIIENGSNESYIGSSIDLAIRLRGLHDLGTSSSTLGTEHLLYSCVPELGPNAFTFHLLHRDTNFVAEFMQSHPGPRSDDRGIRSY